MGGTAGIAGLEEEQAELAWLLASGVLGRSNNLARMLTFICERSFEGREGEIREHSIAVEALGRRPDFDPHLDTIVRVTAHTLRKRLVEVYQHEGAGRPLRLVIPPGHYAPMFVRQVPDMAAHAVEERKAASVPVLIEPPVEEVVSGPSRQRSLDRRTGLIAVGLLMAVAAWWWHHLMRGPVAETFAAAVPQETVRALLGGPRKPYVDHSGNSWAAAKYCEGGSDVRVPPQKIEGTEDAALYLGGIRGIVHCTFPVTGSLYEVHLHFAETTDLAAAMRPLLITINSGRAEEFDVVDSAGGDGIATTRIVTNVAPENDGAIHIDLSSETTLWNAVELLPAPSGSQLPVRIVASSNSFVDEAGVAWSSDRYFSGGRHGLKPAQGRSGLGLYAADRIGRFRYNIPAVPLRIIE